MNEVFIGLNDDGEVFWHPSTDGNLLVTGRAGCGKTWWLTHTLVPALNAWGVRAYLCDGYVRRGYTEPVEGTVLVENPMTVLDEPDAVLIVDHMNIGIDDDLALIENVRDAQSGIPIVMSVQSAPDSDRWDTWNELRMPSSSEMGYPRIRVCAWKSAHREVPMEVLLS